MTGRTLLALAITSSAAIAQQPAKPPTALPGLMPPRAAARTDSALLAHQRAMEDTARRRDQAKADSMQAAFKGHDSKGMPPRQSPLFGSPPFYGYTWVFIADVLIGCVAGGMVGFVRRRAASPRMWRKWGTVGVVLGGIAGGCIFLLLFFLSGLPYFSPVPTAQSVFFASLGVMFLPLAVAMLVSRPRPPV